MPPQNVGTLSQAHKVNVCAERLFLMIVPCPACFNASYPDFKFECEDVL
jgi:hypothetical protein